ncbi:hypothetical protein [Pseudomonas sp. PLB05]|uniref:hypothetical protein n=1 Tax=Pseudomonas sp. PLB05 TaxID=2899078 RepID=UPI001E53C8D9|nr:hypothetical protein [Pseudomonas sp. PLB05]MCD4866977.1 hypothetical protein [Pseudomonas sp. PLB05]
MVSKVAIHKATSTIVVDSVTFNIAFDKVTIKGGHPQGPVFVCGTAQAVISKTDADLLVAAGAVDLR